MHGTVLHSVDRDKMFRVLRVDQNKQEGKGLARAGDRVAGISELADVHKDSLLLALVGSFIKDKEWFLGGLGQDEAARAEIIASTRYRSDGWNLSR
jgi:lipoate-protein ligase A